MVKGATLFRFLVSALLGFSSLGIFPVGLVASSADVATWWNAATAASGAASSLVASRTVIRIEELDESGRVASYEEGETRLDWSSATPAVVVVRADKNGKDVTADWRKRYEKSARDAARSGTDAVSGSSSKGQPAGFDATPFDPRYAGALTRGQPRVAGTGIEVPYVIATEGGLIEGVASFSGTGAAIRAMQTWVKPPVFVSSMNSTIRYAYQDGVLVVAGMRIEGEASILFIKRRFRMNFDFSDWRKAPR